MFDIGAAELLVIAIVAILVIGPKDMPLALRTAGRWIGQVRRVSSHFRAGIDAMVREAEIEDMEKKWKERNAQIMRDHPASDPVSDELAGEEMMPLPPPGSDANAREKDADASLDGAPDPQADDPAPDADAAPHAASAEARAAEPRLPLDEDDKA